MFAAGVAGWWCVCGGGVPDIVGIVRMSSAHIRRFCASVLAHQRNLNQVCEIVHVYAAFKILGILGSCRLKKKNGLGLFQQCDSDNFF